MRTMHRNLLGAAALLICAAGWAQQSGTPAPTPIAYAQGQVAAATEFTDGEVRKVDKEGKRLTIRHGEIRNLDMPPMTMVFGVSEPSMLDGIKAGDKIRFRAADQQGKLTVTEIQAPK